MMPFLNVKIEGTAYHAAGTKNEIIKVIEWLNQPNKKALITNIIESPSNAAIFTHNGRIYDKNRMMLFKLTFG